MPDYFRFQRNTRFVKIIVPILIISFLTSCTALIKRDNLDILFKQGQLPQEIKLPEPNVSGRLSVEEAISIRGTVKDFARMGPLTLDEISQILWAAQGITKNWKMTRAAPSAGLTYPLELYLIVEKNGVNGLYPGIYHYIPNSHSLGATRILRTDIKDDFNKLLSKFISVPGYILKAPVIIAITADFKKTLKRFKRSGRDYVYMEVGFVGENICLQATALGLAVSIFGEFNKQNLSDLLDLPKKLKPLLIISIGRSRK